MAAELSKMDLDQGQFLDLLAKLIGESKYLQNNPPELVPVEDRCGEAGRGSKPVADRQQCMICSSSYPQAAAAVITCCGLIRLHSCCLLRRGTFLVPEKLHSGPLLRSPSHAEAAANRHSQLLPFSRPNQQ